MKILLCLSMLISGFAYSANNMRFGIVTGLNLGSFSDVDGADSSLGVDVGGAMLTSINSNMNLLTELTYSTYGMKVEVGTAKTTTTVSYLELKPKFMFNLTPAIAISAGPNLGIKVGSNVKAEVNGQSQSASLNGLKSLRAGLNAGLAFNWISAGMHLIPRIEYDLGLTSVAESGGSKANAIKFSLTTLF